MENVAIDIPGNDTTPPQVDTGPPAVADPSASTTTNTRDASTNTTTATTAAVGTSSHANLQRKLSISQSANESAGGWNAPWFLSFLEYPFHIRDPVDANLRLTEAAGWGMDSAARGPLNQVGGFVGSAIIRLAAADVGCTAPNACQVPVRGGLLKPSSLLTASSTIVGIFGAIVMPFLGAIVDHTKHRKMLGAASGFVVVLVAGLQTMISIEPNNWLYIFVLDSIGTFGLAVHTTAVFAYLPDLTTHEESIPKYSAAFSIRQYAAQLVYSGLLITTNKARGADRSLQSTVQTAKDACGMAFGFGALFMGYAWIFLFRKRPPLSQVPDGQSLLGTGLSQVKNTSAKIWKDYTALKWFMISLLWSFEAGSGVVMSIVVSFLTVDVKVSSTQLAYISLNLMASNIVGSFFSKWVNTKMNALNAYRAGLISLSLSVIVSTILIKGPDDTNVAIGMASLWGFSMGWMYPCQRVLFCTLIPKGQETEMMGLLSFTGQILGWLPPLVVTAMNENGVELRFGMLVITGFSMLSLLCTLLMGNYEDAVNLVATVSEPKLNAVLALTKGENAENHRTSLLTVPDQSESMENIVVKKVELAHDADI